MGIKVGLPAIYILSFEYIYGSVGIFYVQGGWPWAHGGRVHVVSFFIPGPVGLAIADGVDEVLVRHRSYK